MACYNCRSTISASLTSLLDQTFQDLEVIVVDDGSEDDTVACLKEFNDPRVSIILSETNRGLAAALNTAIEVARGEFVARMDADDWSHPLRFHRQLSVFERDPNLGILGTGCRIIDQLGQPQGRLWMPASDAGIRWRSTLGNPFIHPTVMLRRSILVDNGFRYRADLEVAQDYELWCRILSVTTGANLPEPLLNYRISEGLTSSRRSAQLTNHDEIALQQSSSTFRSMTIEPKTLQDMRSLFVGGRKGPRLAVSRANEVIETRIEMLNAIGVASSPGAEAAGEIAGKILQSFSGPQSLRLLYRLSKAAPVWPLGFARLLGRRLLTGATRLVSNFKER